MNDEKLKSEIVKVNSQTVKEDMSRIISLINNSGAIEQSHMISKRYLNKALDVLDRLPTIKAKKSLLDIANYIGKRKY